MARTADRPVASGRISPTTAIAFGALLGLSSFALLSLTVNPLAAALSLSGLLGYVFVYTLWLKRTTPQNIVIGGAAGRRAAAGRLGRGHRRAQRHRLLPLRDRLLLDPAPLLGALAADEGRVREGRRADDAGRPWRGRDPPPDPPLHDPALRGDPAALLRRRLRGRVPGRLDDPRRRLHLLRGAAAAQRRPPLGPAHLPLLARLPGAALPGDAATRPSAGPDRNPAVDRETSRRDMAAGLLAGGIAAGVFALCFVAAMLYIAS